MEFVEPKCPTCQKTIFGYKRVPEARSILRFDEEIQILEKDIAKYSNQPEKNKKYERRLKKFQDRLYNLLDNPSRANNTEAFLIFCMSCGKIIGTGGGPYKVSTI